MKKLLPFFIVLISFNALSAQSAKAIVDQYLEVIGGAEQWKKIKTMRTTASMNTQVMAFEGVIYAKYPDKQLVELDIQGQKLIQAYDGETAWWINPMMGIIEPQQMPEDLAQSMSSQKFESPFINYEEKGNTIELLGEKELDGITTYEVRLGRADGITELYYFDKSTLLPIKMSTKSTDGQITETHFSDYREINGGLIAPYGMNVKVDDVTIQVLTFDEITLNEELGDDIFAYPKK